jgi:hypothetical protein
MATGNGSPPQQFGLQDLWELRSELKRLGDFQSWHQQNTVEDLAALELRIKLVETRFDKFVETKFDKLYSEINAAIRWFAIAAATIIFGQLWRVGGF